MGLQDLLAVVLGVKTAEALQERRAAEQRGRDAVREIHEAVEAESAAEEAEESGLTPAWEQRVQPLLDRLVMAVPAMADEHRSGRMHPHVFGLIELPSLYAAYIAGDDFGRYCAALRCDPDTARTRENFAKDRALLGAIHSGGGDLFDQVVDVYLDDPESVIRDRWSDIRDEAAILLGVGSQLQRMRWRVGLGPLTKLPTTKQCPRCAETVQLAAQVCRFCCHEFVSGASATPR